MRASNPSNVIAYNGFPRRARHAGASVVLASSVLLTLGVGSGCVELKLAPNAKGVETVLDAAAQVIQDRYYQTRVYRGSSMVRAVSPIQMEGQHKVRHQIFVDVRYERTGHYMPKVFVVKYYDTAEPGLESGDFTDPYTFGGRPYPVENWTAVHYDRKVEEEIRDAILARLSIPSSS